jgi:hypothetical protein
MIVTKLDPHTYMVQLLVRMIEYLLLGMPTHEHAVKSSMVFSLSAKKYTPHNSYLTFIQYILSVSIRKPFLLRDNLKNIPIFKCWI